MIAVVPIVSYYYLKSKGGEERVQTKKWYQLIPLFVVGFLIMAGVRTIGDSGMENTQTAFGLFSPEQWKFVTESLNTFGSTYLLGIAMADVGLSTNLKLFKNHGLKPFCIGMIAAVTVTLVSLVMVYLLGGMIKY